VLLDACGGNGSSGVGKVRFAVRESDSSTERLEILPSSDEGIDGVGRLGNPETLSTDVAILSIAELIGGTIGGTKFGISVALDVSVAVKLRILEVVVISANPVVVRELLPSMLDPNTAGMLSAGLVATRGGKVVNSFGRTRSGIGVGDAEAVSAPLLVAVAPAGRSVEVDVVIVPLFPLKDVVEVPFKTSLSVTARLCSQTPR